MNELNVTAYASMPRPQLMYGRFSVMAVQPNHIELIRQWRNAQMDVLRQEAIITLEQQVAYFSTHIWPDLRVQQPQNILLIYLDGDKPIGYGGLVHIAWEHRRAELSFLLDPTFAMENDQYMILFSSFLWLIRVLAFEDLGLERLFAETYAMREHHMSVLESSGFRREGILKHHVRVNGRPIDSVFHGLLKCQNG